MLVYQRVPPPKKVGWGHVFFLGHVFWPLHAIPKVGQRDVTFQQKCQVEDFPQLRRSGTAIRTPASWICWACWEKNHENCCTHSLGTFDKSHWTWYYDIIWLIPLPGNSGKCKVTGVPYKKSTNCFLLRQKTIERGHDLIHLSEQITS